MLVTRRDRFAPAPIAAGGAPRPSGARRAKAAESSFDKITLSGAQAGVGQVPLLWIRKDLRRKGIGIQLLGQAVSVYRGMGRTALRLRCSPKNTPAQQFYKKYGFTKRGDVPGAQGSLDLLELSI